MPHAGLRGEESQLARQPRRQHQLAAVAGTSHLASRLDAPSWHGDPPRAHVKDENAIVTERLDVLDLDQVVIFHGGLPARNSASPRPPQPCGRYPHLATPVKWANGPKARSNARSGHDVIAPPRAIGRPAKIDEQLRAIRLTCASAGTWRAPRICSRTGRTATCSCGGRRLCWGWWKGSPSIFR